MLYRVLDIEAVCAAMEKARDKYDYETDKVTSAILNAANSGKDNVLVNINFGGGGRDYLRHCRDAARGGVFRRSELRGPHL